MELIETLRSESEIDPAYPSLKNEFVNRQKIRIESMIRINCGNVDK
jgi:hypothetical protein